MENNPTSLVVVAAAVSDGAGNWLMYRRPPGKQHGGLWEFPGGKVDRGETPEVALCRELAEEIDIELAPKALKPATFAFSEAAAGKPAILILLYLVTHWTGEPRALEGGEIAWCTEEEVTRLDKPPLDIELASQFFGVPAR